MCPQRSDAGFRLWALGAAPANRSTRAPLEGRPARRPKAGSREPRARSEGFVHLTPVHDVPPRPDVIGTTILVLQVVRVLPHVEAEKRRLAVHQRIVLIR